MSTIAASAQDHRSSVSREKTLVIAHRGASGSAPENTLAAVKKALDMGADMVEIDVHLSQDGQVVVIHDHTLDRTTDGSGLISMTSSTEIKQLDAGSWFSSEFAGEKVPTLEEVLQTVDGKARLLIEVKKGEELYDGIEDTVLSLVRRYDAGDWCIVQSFQDKVIEKFRLLGTDMPVHKLMLGPVPLLPFLHDGKLKWGGIGKYGDVSGININKRFAKKRLVEKIHAQGQTTYVWTVNEPAKMRKLVNLGVDGVITNHPEYFAE